VSRKDSIILQLEQKIRSQEATIQTMSTEGRATRSTRSNREDAKRIQVSAASDTTSWLIDNQAKLV